MNEQYPSAPQDPEERRRWVERRNALIQGYTPSEEQVEADLARQDAQRLQNLREQIKRMEGK